MPSAIIEAVISGMFELLGEVIIEVVADAVTPDSKKGAEQDVPGNAGPGSV